MIADCMTVTVQNNLWVLKVDHVGKIHLNPDVPQDTAVRAFVELCNSYARKEPHCATCQCNKVHGVKPVPNNAMSRSWHDNSMSPTEPKT